jgi:hypothetical protein
MTKKTYRLHCKEINEMKLRPSHPRPVSVPQRSFVVLCRKIVFLSEPEGRGSASTACLLSISVVSGRPISGIVLVYSRRISLRGMYILGECSAGIYVHARMCTQLAISSVLQSAQLRAFSPAEYHAHISAMMQMIYIYIISVRI